MDNSRIETKVDKIMEDISEIKVTLAKNTASLEIHVKRSDLLEEKLIPVEKHVYMVNGALKLLGLIAILTGIIEGLLKLIK